MKKLLFWGSALLVLIAFGLVIRDRYVLDSQRLDATIKENLPPGTSKASVIHFINASKPVVWDDLGTRVKARLTGRSGSLVYRKDIALEFEFDANGRLLSFSKKEYLTGF